MGSVAAWAVEVPSQRASLPDRARVTEPSGCRRPPPMGSPPHSRGRVGRHRLVNDVRSPRGEGGGADVPDVYLNMQALDVQWKLASHLD